MKRSFSICLITLSVLALAGCGQYDSKASYFNGAVLAEYHQTRWRGSNDTFTLTYLEPGSYRVNFAVPPGKSMRGIKYMPQIFNTVIEQAPRVQVISQYVLPDHMRVIITHDGVTEIHDFQ